MIKAIALLLCAGLLSSQALAADASNHTAGAEARSIRAIKIEGRPNLDGELKEEIWFLAPVASSFRQKEPHEGEAATEETEVRVVYNSSSIFFGVICRDSSPDKIIATELRRDDELENDDSFSIVLDTFHDHRNAFLFRTNPLGTQFDALITEEGRNLNKEWDEKWQVAARVTESGWAAEIEIPFKTLRLSGGGDQTWGIDFQRVIRRKNEFDYWNSYRRNFKFEQVSQAGHLVGLQGLEAGLRLRIKPFLKGGFSQASGAGGRNESEVGLEVLKYRLTPGLTADFTLNTDFAESEVDEQQSNLDRFPLFFPEKREFFLEGMGIFEFGITRGEGPRPEMKLFHSRRIGLSPSGEAIPIIGGARLTGRLGKFNLGILDVQTGDFKDKDGRILLAGSNYGVVRIKRDVFSRSNIGAFFTNRQSSLPEDFNRMYGFDTNFVFFKNLGIGSFLVKSQSPGLGEDDWAGFAGIDWESDFLAVGINHLIVEPNFNNDLGFVPRRDMRKTAAFWGIKPRPRGELIRQFRFQVRTDYIADSRNVLESRTNHYTFEINFQSGDALLIAPHTRFERLDRPFRIRPGVVVPAGDYSWHYVFLRYKANPARMISGEVHLRREWGFFGGDLITLRIMPLIKPTANLSFNLDYEINKASLPWGRFTDHVVNSRINYSFTGRWLTSATIQYNNSEGVAGLNLRLNYIYRPGDDFFIIYNEFKSLNGGPKDRAFVVKLTHSFDF